MNNCKQPYRLRRDRGKGEAHITSAESRGLDFNEDVVVTNLRHINIADLDLHSLD
jgi:hypothetical protein